MVRVQVEGASEVAKALAQLSTRVSKRLLRDALTDAAEPMRKRMSSNAPVDEAGGEHLRDHIVVSTSTSAVGAEGAVGRGDAQQASVVVGPSKPFFYGGMHEFGTVKLAAHPWARPAFDAEVAAIPPAISKVIWRELAGRGINAPMGTSSGPVMGGPGGGTL